MKIKDIDLNHFNIKLERKRADGTLGKISIKSKEEFAKKYKNLLLDYDFQTELWVKNAVQYKNIAVSDLTDKEQISIKQSIVAKLNKGLKLQKNSISKTTVAESIADDDFDFDELDIVEEITPKQTNDLNLQDDFDFEDDVLSKDFNNEETLVNEKHLNDEFDFDESDVKPETTLETISKDFDFDFDDDDVLDTPAPKKTIKDVVTNYNLKDDLSNEEEIMKTLPYFHLFSGGYRLTIHFNSKTFSASGDNQKIVNSLHHLATLIFINYDFLTSEKHPEWLYSALQDDVKVIFENTISLNHDTFVEMDAAIKVIEAGIYSALFNYRNILEYFKHHKPLAIEHE